MILIPVPHSGHETKSIPLVDAWIISDGEAKHITVTMAVKTEKPA